MTYQTLFADPRGRTPRGHFLAALTLFVVTAVVYRLAMTPGLNSQWVMFTLLYPAFVLFARRLHDMGLTAWLTLPPGLVIAAAMLPDNLAPRGTLEAPLTVVAAVVFVAMAVWCGMGKGTDGANRFGEAVPA
jgi:uncharacterized membrane protein YhaH (DUF805 family)